MKHLTTVLKEGGEVRHYTVLASIPPSRGQQISDALVKALDGKSNAKSEFVCDCIESGVLEPEAQRIIELTLDLVDSYGPLSTRTPDERMVLLDVRKALMDCFVRKTSTSIVERGMTKKYEKRYGDEY